MRKQIQNKSKIKFKESEPPFAYDQKAKGASEKLAYANKIGLGKITDKKEPEVLRMPKRIASQPANRKRVR